MTDSVVRIRPKFGECVKVDVGTNSYIIPSLGADYSTEVTETIKRNPASIKLNFLTQEQRETEIKVRAEAEELEKQRK